MSFLLGLYKQSTLFTCCELQLFFCLRLLSLKTFPFTCTFCLPWHERCNKHSNVRTFNDINDLFCSFAHGYLLRIFQLYQNSSSSSVWNKCLLLTDLEWERSVEIWFQDFSFIVDYLAQALFSIIQFRSNEEIYERDCSPNERKLKTHFSKVKANHKCSIKSWTPMKEILQPWKDIENRKFTYFNLELPKFNSNNQFQQTTK